MKCALTLRSHAQSNKGIDFEAVEDKKKDLPVMDPSKERDLEAGVPDADVR